MPISADDCDKRERSMLMSVRFWARMIAINACAALLAVIAFSGAAFHTTPWGKVFESAAVSFTFSTSISPFCVAALTRLAPSIMPRYPAAVAWSIVASTLTGIGVAGTMFATGVMVAIGYAAPGQYWHVMRIALPQALVFTLTIGLFATAYGRAKDQLAATNLALRTKERDEAQARRLATEAQLASLESRVQPHFLFNTLNSIAALAHDDPQRAEKMTTELAALLRSSLDQQTPLVPLDEEIAVVRSYLEIERVRFGDRLRYRIDADAAVNGVRVPRLAVQTLVENSVKYAVSPRREGGSIAVRARADAGVVRVSIEDDGPGFDATTLPDGHGLALLRSRLDMLFGERAAMRIDSRPGSTCVEIAVPQ